MKSLKTIRIIISSTSELLDDIKEIELFINRKNKLSIRLGVFYELVLWSEYEMALSSSEISEKISNDIFNCDAFIFLFHFKLGIHTSEAFEQIFRNYKAVDKPYLFVFFKNSPVSLESINIPEFDKLRNFQEKLKKNGLLYSQYENIESLKQVLSNQLDALVQSISKLTIKKEETRKRSKSIFISYNHKDSKKVNEVNNILREQGFNVIIDSSDIDPGEDIKTFIKDSILNTDITLSVVSKNSLLSSWVGLESIESFKKESRDNKKFLAIVLEKTFYERTFTGDALESIEKEITQIVEILKDRLEKRRGFEDLYSEFQRYILLRNSIDEIVRRLKESFSVDISEGNFETGMEKIVLFLKE